MSSIEEIKDAISDLPEPEFAELRRWLAEKDWERWDDQIRQDSEVGKLDFLLNEAKSERANGTLNNL